MPHLGFLKLRGSVETGFAQPTPANTMHSVPSRSKGKVQRKPPLPLCGVVAQQPCCQRVAALVEGDGHQRHQRADDNRCPERSFDILPFSVYHIILF